MINKKDALAQSLELNNQEQDPLLGCLVFLSKFYGKPFSAEAMSSGLPLEDGKLSPKLMPRAALRAGNGDKTKEKRVEKITLFNVALCINAKRWQSLCIIVVQRR